MEHWLALASQPAILSTARAGISTGMALASRQGRYPQYAGMAVLQWPGWRGARVATQ
ncbi:hypothetical protein D3C75_1160550 [compost metagenome]